LRLDFFQTLKIARFSDIFPPPAMRFFYPAKERRGGMETYLTIAELAEHIKLSEQTIRRYVLNREIPYHKIKKAIRFKPSEVERWIASGGPGSSAGGGSELEGDLFAGIDDERRLPAADSKDGETGEVEA
jgi:excisionase family DNA binding protein